MRQLRRHQKEKHSEDFVFKCEHYNCGQTFSSNETLKKHQFKHVKIPCTQCGKLIQTKGMQKHIRQIHGSDEKIVCDLCGKVSNSIQMHKYHVRSEHEVHERLQCDICKEWFVSIEFISWVIEFSIQIQSFWRYKNKENLRSHMKSIHVEGPQTCTICGRISTNMKSLAKHKKIHTAGSKERFKCIVCEKGFRDRTKLKVNWN